MTAGRHKNSHANGIAKEVYSSLFALLSKIRQIPNSCVERLILHHHFLVLKLSYVCLKGYSKFAHVKGNSGFHSI